MKITRKKLILIILIALIGVIVLFSIIYHQTALWKPEQSLITLLPETPLCYLTLKELKGLINTFNRSEFGKQAAQMPILSYIKNQLWWRQLVYQKWVWEMEMGGRLDMKAVKGHFGTEAILALYQREGELSFLLITEVGGAEKLAIEAITATDVINPKYKRIQTKYNDLTINTITGYPLDFSYTFIGKIGVLSLNPLLLAEVIDIYAGKKDGFLAKHKIKEDIQRSYDTDKNTGYFDVAQLSALLNGLVENSDSLIGSLSQWKNNKDYWVFGNRYENGVIISQSRYSNSDAPQSSQSEKKVKPKYLPEQTALVTFNPDQDWTKFAKLVTDNLAIEADSGNINILQHFNKEMTFALVSHSEGDVSKFPSLILRVPVKETDTFATDLDMLKNMKITVSGLPLEFLETQDYKGITVQPVRIRLNFLLALTGAYAVVGDNFIFSTTLTGIKSVLDTFSGDTSELSGVAFSTDSIQTYIQPNLLVPEITRFIPIATILASLSGYKLDAVFMRRLKYNLFPLASLGPITADVHVDDKGVFSDIRIVLEE